MKKQFTPILISHIGTKKDVILSIKFMENELMFNPKTLVTFEQMQNATEILLKSVKNKTNFKRPWKSKQ